jgi:hypothetical protein
MIIHWLSAIQPIFLLWEFRVIWDNGYYGTPLCIKIEGEKKLFLKDLAERVHVPEKKVTENKWNRRSTSAAVWGFSK